ncbi:folic acid synthesis protein-like protein [Periconia macrospinosa]|uniref:Folic acid synthesis protein FOL1 n=1 Tax=Periconia macrospinosa TaxID=97972 RepID=A0A2V1DIT6_9PLEO|nr:folic acid synthesis protein-like protein [Periconia macrospinosa]
MKHRAFIALGSNLGDRINMIEQACREMDNSGKIKILRTSSLWETKAMYVQDQDKFINGVCEVETSLSPLALLDELQAIEKKMGRVKIIDKGPRNIDLDVLLYNDSVYSDERLTIPHALMLEREFVLRPLCELIPEASLPAQANLPAGSLQSHLGKLPISKEPLSPLTRLCPSQPNITATRSDRDTRIMAILNITPDSFSDGGKHYGENLYNLPRTIKSNIEYGATILDVGGQSTRPGSTQLSSDVEIDRVVPVIKLIRGLPEAKDTAISVDTYRADVARQAVEAGADIVNDVSAGLLDDDMLSTVAQLGCTVCLMHMRGTPETMNSLTQYPDGVIETVGRELLDRVRAAEAAGIRRWRIILDPGIGFAKNQEQNLELLRRLNELREYPGLQGLPWLVGTSRKKFIGDITGEDKPANRLWGTGAAITAAIQGGADILRVHDTKVMTKVARMADAIWRV